MSNSCSGEQIFRCLLSKIASWKVIEWPLESLELSQLRVLCKKLSLEKACVSAYAHKRLQKQEIWKPLRSRVYTIISIFVTYQFFSTLSVYIQKRVVVLV
jgi:hypothetical protein